MSLLRGWIPPSRENWETLVGFWQFFPVVTAAQWIIKWYPAGKTSTDSRLNMPGKWAWLTMEAPGFVLLLYIMTTLPRELGLSSLPWQNWTMAGLYTIHYIYRAILFPILNPSMSPIHPVVWSMAIGFNLINALALGGWLAGHGPASASYWARRPAYFQLGITIWALGLAGNIYHDDELREIRRAAKRKQQQKQEQADKEEEKKAGKADGSGGEGRKAKGVEKVYMIPQNGLFNFILYPHYACEWIEWAGYWMAGGWTFAPGRAFLLNEITTMLPRALQGSEWYIQKFGAEAVGSKKAVIPGSL